MKWRSSISLALGSALIAFGALSQTVNVPGDYPTIQGAIEAVPAGARIEVSPGEYAENLDIVVPVSIVGVGGGAVILVPQAWDKATVVIGSDDAENQAVLESLSFRDSYGIAIQVNGAASAAIRNCSFQDTFANIHTFGTATVHIQTCSMTRFEDTAIVCHDASSVTVTDTTFAVEVRTTGIRTENASKLKVVGCTFAGPRVSSTGRVLTLQAS